MTKLKEIYKCEICGNIIEIIHNGVGTLVCCGKPMIIQKEQSKGKYAEKHAPVIKKNEKGVSINIGRINHPMEKEHYIEWIEIITNKGHSRKWLNPGESPKAKFPLNTEIKKTRMYCNIHGLWVTEKKCNTKN